MIKVAFCDDGVSALDEIREFLDRYRRERNQELNHTAFCNPVKLFHPNSGKVLGSTGSIDGPDRQLAHAFQTGQVSL